MQANPTWLYVIFGSKFTGAATRSGIVAILAGQLAQLALVDMRQRCGCEETLGHVPEQTGRTTAFAAYTECGAIVAHCLIVAMPWLGALCGGSITRARPAAFGLLLALLMETRGHKRARAGQTAGTLRRRALRLGATLAALGAGVQRLIVLADQTWIAAIVLALLLVEAAIAFLARLHNLVAAEGTLGRLEAIPLRVAHEHVEHIGNVAYGAG